MNLVSPESAVKERYAGAAGARQASLCCPSRYDPRYLEVIPAEVIEKDYGCGDPSHHLHSGETVLDLGSGTGKICFIAAQVVGPSGRVIGVDMTPEMLEVARRNQPLVAQRLGYSNVEFKRGRIQDLALDLDLLDRRLRENPVTDVQSFAALEEAIRESRLHEPLIPSSSIEAVVSNCVLNLVESSSKQQLFSEMFRVLRPGGRAVISDIVADEPVPAEMQADPELWTGCISGAFTEEGFLEAFAEAGFEAVQVLERGDSAWRIVHGIEFRSVTVRAFKPMDAPRMERNQAVIYLGPFKEVRDDAGHRMRRGRRCAVSERSYRMLQLPPYRDSFAFVDPARQVPDGEAQLFQGREMRLRHPRETKAGRVETGEPVECCCPGGACD